MRSLTSIQVLNLSKREYIYNSDRRKTNYHTFYCFMLIILIGELEKDCNLVNSTSTSIVSRLIFHCFCGNISLFFEKLFFFFTLTNPKAKGYSTKYKGKEGGCLSLHSFCWSCKRQPTIYSLNHQLRHRLETWHLSACWKWASSLGSLGPTVPALRVLLLFLVSI